MVFPPKCAFCRGVLERGSGMICPDCERTLPWRGEQRVEKKGRYLDALAAPLGYDERVRAALHRYKFGGVTAYARVFGKLVADCVRSSLAGEYDLISWVPLSSERKAERGYDQAMLIALAAALELDDVAVNTLVKVRNVQPQSSKTEASERYANVSGAYEAADAELVRGKRVLLIDDIVTSGATVGECARVLRMAGASGVVCCCLALARQTN